jgi:N6-adenosine-specific RNA methylase IME4
MVNGTYEIILCDPPWDYKGQTQHAGAKSSSTGGAAVHYPTMTVADMIKTIDVLSFAADDCLLFMWATWPHLDQAITLGHGWGFRYVHTPFVWDKVRLNPGYYTMTQTEPVLCFKRGKIPRPRGARNVKQLVRRPREKHSQKPVEVNRRIELMFPTQRKLEMFARRRVEGWDAWGNEIEVQ